MKPQGGNAAEIAVDGGDVGDAGRQSRGDVDGVVGAEAMAGHEVYARAPDRFGRWHFSDGLELIQEPFKLTNTLFHPLDPNQGVAIPCAQSKLADDALAQVRRSRQPEPEIAELDSEDI